MEREKEPLREDGSLERASFRLHVSLTECSPILIMSAVERSVALISHRIPTGGPQKTHPQNQGLLRAFQGSLELSRASK